ncbi:MAG: 50S ribosomal protein L19 [Candidatus Margulisbacteria bacterium]|nr:50S ribosomal protein L19 [Candidatus Margulisiibacteriota bacterium]
MSKIIDELEKAQLKADLPAFNVGDTVKVSLKVIEGKKERIQSFEGIVTKVQNGGVRKNLTVRKVVDGIGVEKTFLVNSPQVPEIKVLRQGKTRRAKLFYLRERLGSKAGRIKAKDPRYN